MNRKFKAIGLAAVAALAMSAVVATMGQAQSPATFSADAYPAVMKGAQEGTENYFEATPGGTRIECNTADYQATLAGESTELTVTPHYSGCSAGGVGATVHLNGCHFKFTAVTTISSTESTGKADVICAKDQSITITAAFGACVNHITGSGNGKNQNLTGVTFTKVSSTTTTVDVDITKEIHVHETNVFGCPVPTGTSTEGSFVSKVTMHCYKDEGTEASTTTGINTYKKGEATACEVK